MEEKRGMKEGREELLPEQHNDFFFKAIFKMWLFDCLALVVIYNPSCRRWEAVSVPAGI